MRYDYVEVKGQIGNILTNFFPVGILENLSNVSYMYFSHLRVCGEKIRLGCQWVQGFQGHYSRSGCDFP